MMKGFVFAFALCVVGNWAVHVGTQDPVLAKPQQGTEDTLSAAPVANKDVAPAAAAEAAAAAVPSAAAPAIAAASYSLSVNFKIVLNEVFARPSSLLSALDAADFAGEVMTPNVKKDASSAQQVLADSNQMLASGAASPPPQTIALGVAALSALVGGMIWALGLEAAFITLVYIGTVASVKFCLKIVYLYDFKFAKFITAFHLGFSSLIGFFIMFYRANSAGKSIRTPTYNEFWYAIVPISLTFGASIVSENSALVFVSTAFSEIVASTGPVVAAVVTVAAGLSFHKMLLIPIAVALVGCCVAVHGEMSFSLIGVLLLFAAVTLRGIKCVLQQKLMAKDSNSAKFDATSLMAYSCGVGFLELAVMSIASEGRTPFDVLFSSSDSGLIVAVVASGFIACALNLSALIVIVHLGAVGMQIVSQLKSILVVIIGIVILGEVFTPMQKIGFGILLVGIFWYSRMKRELDAAAKAQADKAKAGEK